MTASTGFAPYVLYKTGGQVPGQRPRTALIERITLTKGYKMRWDGRRWTEQSRRAVPVHQHRIARVFIHPPTPHELTLARRELART